MAGFTGAIAFAARAFETYAFPTRPDWLPNGVAAAGMVLVAALLHGVKVQVGALAQNIVVFLKVALLIALPRDSGLRGHVAGHRAARRPRRCRSRFAAFAGSLVWISLSYSGFNAAVYVAGEAKDAQRNAPRALWVGTLIVTVLYIALNAAFVYLPPFEAVAGREDVAAAAAQSIGGAPLTLAHPLRDGAGPDHVGVLARDGRATRLRAHGRRRRIPPHVPVRRRRRTHSGHRWRRPRWPLPSSPCRTCEGCCRISVSRCR